MGISTRTVCPQYCKCKTMRRMSFEWSTNALAHI